MSDALFCLKGGFVHRAESFFSLSLISLLFFCTLNYLFVESDESYICCHWPAQCFGMYYKSILLLVILQKGKL